MIGGDLLGDGLLGGDPPDSNDPAANLSQQSSLSAAGQQLLYAATTLSQTSALSAASSVTDQPWIGSSISTASEVWNANVPTEFGVAALTQASTMSGTAVLDVVAGTNLSQESALAATATTDANVANLVADSSALTVVGVVSREGAVALTQNSSLSSAGLNTAVASILLDQGSIITASGIAFASAQLTSTSLMWAGATTLNRFVAHHTSGTSSAAGTTVAATLASNVAAGNVLILAVTADNLSSNTPTVSSISKPGGETASWTSLGAIPSSTATGAGGVVTELWAIKTTQQWNSATTVTVTLSGSVTKKAVVLSEFNGVDVRLRGSAATSTSTGGTPTITSSATYQPGDLVLGWAGFENNAAPTADSDTSNGSWAAGTSTFTTGGGAAANVAVILQYKIITGSGTQTYNPTGSSDSGAGVVGLAVPVFGGADLRSDSGLTSAATVVDGKIYGEAALSVTSTLTVSGSSAIPGSGALVQGQTLTCSGTATGALFYTLPVTLTINDKADVGSAPDASGDTYVFSLPVTALEPGGGVKLSVTSISVDGDTNVPYIVFCEDLASYQLRLGLANPTSSTKVFLLAEGLQNGDIVSGYIQAHVFASDVYGDVGEALTITDVSLVYTPAPVLPALTSTQGVGDPRFTSYPLHMAAT